MEAKKKSQFGWIEKSGAGVHVKHDISNDNLEGIVWYLIKERDLIKRDFRMWL